MCGGGGCCIGGGAVVSIVGAKVWIACGGGGGGAVCIICIGIIWRPGGGPWTAMPRICGIMCGGIDGGICAAIG